LGGLLAGLIMSAWSFTVLGLVVGFAALPLLMACMGTTLRPVVRPAPPSDVHPTAPMTSASR
jgi:hypothetical protein